jgi:uncharacterized membrane protein
MIGLPGQSFHAVLWRKNTVVTLGTDPPGVSSEAIAVNNNDTVVAESHPTGTLAPPIPFLWIAGHRLTLPVPTGFDSVTATGINDRGQVTGYATRDDARGNPESSRTVVWTLPQH